MHWLYCLHVKWYHACVCCSVQDNLKFDYWIITLQVSWFRKQWNPWRYRKPLVGFGWCSSAALSTTKATRGEGSKRKLHRKSQCGLMAVKQCFFSLLFFRLPRLWFPIKSLVLRWQVNPRVTGLFSHYGRGGEGGRDGDRSSLSLPRPHH